MSRKPVKVHPKASEITSALAFFGSEKIMSRKRDPSGRKKTSLEARASLSGASPQRVRHSSQAPHQISPPRGKSRRLSPQGNLPSITIAQHSYTVDEVRVLTAKALDKELEAHNAHTHGARNSHYLNAEAKRLKQEVREAVAALGRPLQAFDDSFAQAVHLRKNPQLPASFAAVSAQNEVQAVAAVSPVAVSAEKTQSVASSAAPVVQEKAASSMTVNRVSAAPALERRGSAAPDSTGVPFSMQVRLLGQIMESSPATKKAGLAVFGGIHAQQQRTEKRVARRLELSVFDERVEGTPTGVIEASGVENC